MQVVVPVQPAAPVQVAQPPVHGSANAVLAAALSAGDFYAPTSPPPVSKRPDNEVNKAYAVLHLVKSFHFAVAMLHCLLPPNHSTESMQFHTVAWQTTICSKLYHVLL